MAVISVEELYEKYVKPLPVREQLRLVTLTAGALSGIDAGDEPRERSLLELEGLGAHLWVGVDAQEYVRQIRSEWDHRP